MDGTEEPKKVTPADILEAVDALSARQEKLWARMEDLKQELRDEIEDMIGDASTVSPQAEEGLIRKDQMAKDLASFRSLMSTYFGPGRPLLTVAVHEKGHAVIRPEVLLVENNGVQSFAVRPLGFSLLQSSADSLKKREVDTQVKALTQAAQTPPQRLKELQGRLLSRASGDTGGSILKPASLSDGTRLDAPDPETWEVTGASSLPV